MLVFRIYTFLIGDIAIIFFTNENILKLVLFEIKIGVLNVQNV
jgi:hypothetical protein